MRPSSLVLCLWPGLGPLWLRGSWSGLAGAAAGGGLLSFVILATFVWPDVMGGELPSWLLPGAGWLLVLCLWVGGGLQARRMLLTWATPPLDDGSEKLFRQAQTDYLKGQWVAAERLLTDLLTKRPADIEGRLLLATVLRRMKRMEDARRELTTLAQLPAAVRWEREIVQEREWLKAAANDKPTLEEADDTQPANLGAATLGAPPQLRVVSPPAVELNKLSAKPATGRPAVKVSSPETDEDDEEIRIIAYERVERERQQRKAA